MLLRAAAMTQDRVSMRVLCAGLLLCLPSRYEEVDVWCNVMVLFVMYPRSAVFFPLSSLISHLSSLISHLSPLSPISPLSHVFIIIISSRVKSKTCYMLSSTNIVVME